MAYSEPSKEKSASYGPKRCRACHGCIRGDDCYSWGLTAFRDDEIRIPVAENETLSFGEGPLRPSGVSKFGFAGEPPDGWPSEERRSLADWRLREAIEDGEPETRFPWGVAIMFLVIVLGILACTIGSIAYLLSRLNF